jgi:hypothetical protein
LGNLALFWVKNAIFWPKILQKYLSAIAIPYCTYVVLCT